MNNLEKLVLAKLYKPKATTYLDDVKLAEKESYETLSLCCKAFNERGTPIPSIGWLLKNMKNLDVYKTALELERSEEDVRGRNARKQGKTQSRESDFKSMFE